MLLLVGVYFTSLGVMPPRMAEWHLLDQCSWKTQRYLNNDLTCTPVMCKSWVIQTIKVSFPRVKDWMNWVWGSFVQELLFLTRRLKLYGLREDACAWRQWHAMDDQVPRWQRSSVSHLWAQGLLHSWDQVFLSSHERSWVICVEKSWLMNPRRIER